VTEPVKRRTYDTALRRANSTETRQRILGAARRLFIAQGYRATTIAAIATEADVNADTVYELAGRKPVLLRELIEQSLSGTDHAVDGEQRAHVVAMRAESDPRVKLAIYARAVRETHERMAPLFAALRDASSTEPESAQVWRDISERRAANMRKLVADVRQADGREDDEYDMSISRAGDVAWAMNSPEMYLMLIGERGWQPDHYEQFLADGLYRLTLA